MDFEAQSAPAASLEPTEPPQAPAARDLWGYRELLYLIAFGLLSLGLTVVLAAAAGAVARSQFGLDLNPESSPHAIYLVLGVQLVWWFFLFGFMYAIVTVQYGHPFWEGIGYRRFRVPAIWFALGGFLLAPLVAVVGHWIDVPQNTPFEQMLESADSLWLLGVFAVVVAPLTEEVTFRGFIFPVVERSHGGWAAVVVTSGLFALLHAQQYGWAWQIILLLFGVGSTLGVLRLKTGGIGPSTIMHAAYNGTLFMALFSAKRMGIESL